MRLQSGALAQDVGFLLQARKLIASAGTFIAAIAGVSEVIENLISFERPLHAVGRRALRSRVLRDVSGAYVAQCMSMNWEASSEQLALMLSFDASNLGDLGPAE